MNIRKRVNDMDLLDLPQFVAKYVGFHPKHKLPLNSIYIASYAVTSILFYYLIILEIIYVYEHLEVLSEALEAVTVFIHATGKFFAFLVNQHTLNDILDTRKKYWKIERATEDVQQSCLTIVWYSKWILLVFFTMGNMSMVAYVAKIFIYKDVTMPLLCYVPEKWPMLPTALLQAYVVIIIVEMMLDFDIMFFGLSIELIVQLKILSNCIANSKERFDKCEDFAAQTRIVKEFVTQHNMLISQCDRISLLLLFSFFSQYAVTTLTTCFELYMLLDSGVIQFETVIRGAIYTTTLFTELSLYCITSEIIVKEMANISYNTWKFKWYETPLSIQKSMGLIMLRSNIQKKFSAGDVLDINMGTIIRVVRTAFSFYTFMKAFKA